MDGSVPEGGSARGSEIVRGLTAEIAVPDWAPHSGVFARVGDDLVVAGPDGETFSVTGYFNAVPRPILTSEDGQPLSASFIQSALAQPHHQQLAQAFGVPPIGADPTDGGEDPSVGNFDIVGIGGQQNPGGVQIPSESLEQLLTSVAAGGNVEQALQAVFQQAAQEAIALGASPEQALQQYEAFANILSAGIAEGINPAQALGEAQSVFLSQNLGAPTTGGPVEQSVSPEQAMLNAIASGDNSGGQFAGSQAFQQALADALQSGAPVNQALDSANVANANVEQALAQTETGTADPLLAALASGENLGVIPAGADFQQALADALANGASPIEAIQAAAAATDAVSNAQNAVNTGGGDPTLQAIASGDASAIGGSPEMIAALSEALQGGAPVDAAMSVAAQADAAIANAVTQSATGGGDPTLQAIASGDASAISGSPEMIAALSEALQGGAPVDAAMTVATQTGAAVSNAVAQTTTGTADPVMQMLASGNTAGLGDNPVLIAALNDALANNASPQQAMQQAQQTQEAVANAQATTNVGGGDNGGLNQIVASSDAPGAGNSGAAAGASGTGAGGTGATGVGGAGGSDGTGAGISGSGGEAVQVADAANALSANAPDNVGAGAGAPGGSGTTATDGGQTGTGVGPTDGGLATGPIGGGPGGGTPSGGPTGGPTGTGSPEIVTATGPIGGTATPPTPLPPLPDFGKINQTNVFVTNYAPPPPPPPPSPPPAPYVSSTSVGGQTSVVNTPEPVVIPPKPVTLVSTPPSQLVREGANFSLDLSPFFSGDGLNFSVVSGLPNWAELSGTKIQNKSGMTAEGDDAGQSTLVIRVTGASGQQLINLTLTVNDVADIETDNANATTFAPIAGDPVAVDPQVTFDDVDSTDFAGAALTVEISYNAVNATSGDDRLSILDIGPGSGQIGFSGTTVSYGGTTIGTVTQAGAGSTPLIVTLNASASEAAIQALMRAVSYQNVNSNPDLTQAPTVNIVLSVGGVDVSNSIARPIELVDNIQPQSNNVSFSTNEDTTVALGIAAFDAQFSDADSGDTLQYVRIDTLPSSALGVLKLDGVAIAAGSSVSRADIVAGKLTFVPAADANNDFGSVSFSFTVSDGKQFAAASDTATIGISAVNDAPNAVIAAASVQYHPDTAAVPIAPAINIVEVDAVTSTQAGRFTGGYLDIEITANRSAGDRLTVDNIGTGAGQIGFNGTTVTYGGVTIGTVVTATDGGAGEKLRISLNGNATPDAVQALARAVTYDNVDAEPGGGARTVSYTVNDGAATGATAMATVSISGVADHFNGSSTVLAFDGNDTMNLGGSSDFINATAMTWEAWIKTEQTTGTQTVIGMGTPGNGTVINTGFASSAGVTLSGSTTLSGGRLRFTQDGVGGEHGTAVISPTGGMAGATNFSASFDLFMYGGGGLADGVSFNYGVFSSGVAEQGLASGLSITFDTYSNGPGDTGIEIFFNGSRIGTANTAIDFTSSAGKAVTVAYTDSGLTVTVGGSTVVSNLAIPAYATAGKTSYQYSFGARTGGETSTQEIDNLQITAQDSLSTGNALVVKNGQLAFSEIFHNSTETNNSGVSVADGNWHQIAASWSPANGGTLQMYVDGQPAGGAITGVSKDMIAGAAWLGRDSVTSGNSFTGEMAEVRIWGDVRTPTEIAANYLPGLSSPGSQPDLVSYWNFDGVGSSQTVNDQGPGNHDAILGVTTGAGSADPMAAERPEFSNWRVIEGSTSATDSIVVANGVATITNREILQSAEKYTPTSGNPVHVTGKFNYQNDGDIFTVVTRDNSNTRDSFGSPDGGIHFDINDVNNQNIIQIWGETPEGVRTLRGSAQLDLRAGVHYTFDVYDDGTNIRLTVSEVGDPTNSATVIATDSLASQADSYVIIHNRDGSGGNYVLNLEDVRIDDDVVLSEDGSMSGTLSAPSPLTGTLTYSLVDAAGHGSFAITNAATGAYTYTPSAGYHGRDFITYQVVDASGRSHVETMIFDVVADTDVQIGGAHLEFDGSNDYVQVANAPELQLTTNFTIEAWVRAGDVAHDQLIAGKTDGTNHDFLFKINTAGKLAWFNGASDTIGNASVDDGQWHHVAVTYENGVVKLYIDGVRDTATTTSAPGTSTKPFYMGGDGDTSQVLSGGLDEVRVWDHARSEDDIRLNYDQNASGSESGLVGYWTFDNVVDGTAKDLSGDGNTAQLGGLRLGDNAQPQVVGGGKALAFDGTDDAVNFGSGPSNSFRVTGSMTAEGWFNFAELKTEELIAIAGNVGDGVAADNYLFLMRLTASGTIELFHEYGTGSTQVSLSFTPGIAINEWTHLAAVRDATAKTYSLYMDGVPVGTESYSAQSNPDGGSAASLRLGSVVTAGTPSGEFFHGQMDDIRLWNTARTAAEIAANYQAVLAGAPTGLLAQYTFDDGTLSSTLGNNTGTASGGTAFVDAVPTGTQPSINGGTITIAEDTTLSGQMTPDTALSGSVTYSVQTAGDKGGTITVDAATGHWTYTPLDNFYGTETFTLRAAGSTSGTDDETITVTVEQHSVPSVDVSDGHIQFDGVDDRVAVGRGTTDSLAIAGDLTIESWMRANTFATDQTIAEFGAQGETSATNILYNLRLTSGGDIVFDHENGAGVNNSLTFDTNLSADVWHHVAAVRDVATKTVSIYIDGDLFGTKSYTTDPTGGGSASLLIGAQYSGTAPGPNNYFDGALDDLRIWNTARTAEEISTNYDRQLTGSEANLQGNWRFDGATGGTIEDATANNNDGTLVGDPTIAPPLGSALKFDGNGQVTVGTDSALNILGDLTLESWIKFDAAGEHTIAEWGAAGESLASNIAYHLRVDANGDVVYGHEIASTFANIEVTFDTNLDVGQWHHLALVRDVDTNLLKLFVNGVLAGSSTYATGPSNAVGGSLVIGSSPSAGGLNLTGSLSDLRLWNVARSDADIAANYAHTLIGAQTGLVANYTMDEIVGGQVVDSAGTNNATVTGAVVVDADPAVFGTVLKVNENESVSGAMTGNDVVGTPTFGLSGAGAVDADGRVNITTANGGTVVLDTTSGAWTYTPADKYHGSDSFTLTASGQHGTSDSETVSVTVAQVDRDSVDVSDGVLTLDGVNDHVNLGTLSGLGATGAITMEAWVNFASFDSGTAGTGWMRIFDFGQGEGDDNVFLAIDGTTGNIHFASWTGSTSSGFSTPAAIALNEWTHIAAVNNGDGSGAIYINGELVASVASGLAAVTNVVRDENYIGRSTWAQDDYTSAMIDDARVWTVARTAEQIRANYDQQLNGSETGLYANWRFDDDALSGGVSDSSGNGHNGARIDGAYIDNDDGGPGIFGTRLTVYNDEDASGKMTANDVMGTPSYSVATAASSGTVTIDASTGAWTYTPAANFVGTATFTLQAAGGGLTDQETVTVTVKSDDNVNVSDGVLQLDGIDDHVSFGDTGDIGSGSLTVEAWIDFNDTANTTLATILAKGNASATAAGYSWFHPGGGNDVLRVRVGDGSLSANVDIDTSATGIPDGWHHVSMVVDRTSDTVKVYVDGALYGSAAFDSSVNIDTASNLVIGKTSALASPWGGAVDELRVWGSARTAEQIYDNHDKTLANQSGLTINYHADSLSHSGATFSGGMIVPNLGGALRFDGIDDAVRVEAGGIELANQSFSWEFWANRDPTSSGNDLVLSQRGAAGTDTDFFHAGWVGTDTFRFSFDGAGADDGLTWSDPSGSSMGQWHHWAGTYDAAANLAKLFKDGVLVAVKVMSADLSVTNRDFYIGGAHDGTALAHAFDGLLSDVRIWNVARTDAEIAANYAHTLTGSQSGLVSNYTMDEIVGGQLVDSAGANNGTVSGATIVETSPDVFGTALSITENESISGTVGDGIEGLSFTVTGAGAADADGRVSATTTHGTITIDTTSGAWTYTPTANYHGADSFTVTTSDANGNSNSETVAVTISQVDHLSNRVGSSALHFDGVDDYVSLPANLAQTADITIETWFKWDGTGTNWQRVFDFGANASNPTDEIFLSVNGSDNGGKMVFAIRSAGGGTERMDVATATPVNSWTHVAVTINSATNIGSIYINGELVARTSLSLDPSQLASLTSLLIGKSNFPADPYFAGDMADFRIWTTARTDEQIRDNYDQRITDTPSGLALNYTFDDVANAVVQDATSNNRDGIISGNAATVDPAVDVPVHGNVIVINEDETASGQMTGSDVVGTATYSVPSQPGADTGTVTINSSTGAWVYTPPENWSGTATFSVRATGGGITDTETVTVTVKENAAVPDVHQGALQLDGVNDYFVAPGINLGGGSFTIELWINRASATGADYFVSQGNEGSTDQVLHFGYVSSTAIRFAFWGDDLDYVDPSATSGVGEWVHWAASYDAATNQQSLYRNGQLVASRTASGDFINGDADALEIGRFGYHGNGVNNFGGMMDEVRIWTTARTAVEIQTNYDKQVDPTQTNLEAYYRMDNMTNRVIHDATGNGNHLSQAPTDHGATGNVLSLDGTNDYVTISVPTTTSGAITIPEINLGATTFTLEAWIKTTATGRTILSKSETGVWEAGGKDFGIDATGKLYFNVHGDSGVDLTSTNTASVADGEWHHVSFVYSSGTGTFYIDGVASGGGALALSADDIDHEIFIGARAGADQYFNGQIDEVRIWSTARSDVELREGMTEKYDFDESGLKAQYSFEDGATNSANAYASTTFDGSLTNGATTTDSGSSDPFIVHPPATALNFDGTNDVVSMGAAIAPTGSAARTIMLWAKTSSSADQTFLSYGSAAGSQGFGFGLNSYGSSSQGVTIDVHGAAITFQPLTSSSDGQWHHYAVVLPSGGDSLRDLKVYQDGILLTGIAVLATGDAAINTSGASSFTLGSYLQNNHYFNGQMFDVSVWSAALTAAQIRDYATNGLAGTESDLTALWRLDEGTGSTVYDVAGAATNGTINGAAWVDGAPDVDGNFLQIVENGSANGRMTAEDVSGAATYSLFDGPDHGTMQLNSVTGEWTYVPNNGYQGTDSFTLRATGATSGIDDEVVSIKVGTPPTINPNDSVLVLDGSTGHVDVGTLDGLSGDLTIEAWIKWDGEGAVSGAHTWARIVDFGTGQDGDNILLAANGASGELSFDIRQNGATTYSTVKTVADMPLNEWIHVAATTNGSTASLYINGVLQTLQGGGTSGAMVSALDVSRTSSFIGESNWAAESTSDFQITDVRVWNDERSAQEIADNYERRLNGDEQGLYAYWRLDEGSGHVAVDSSGNGRDGAVVGGASYASQTQIQIIGGTAYKGLVLGSDADHDNLSYSVAVADGGAPDYGTFSFDASSNTYTYDPTDGYSGDDSVTINVTDNHNQTTQHTIQFHMA